MNVLLIIEDLSACVAGQLVRVRDSKSLVLFVVTELQLALENAFDVHH
jgi:hypothetical protein